MEPSCPEPPPDPLQRTPPPKRAWEPFSGDWDPVSASALLVECVLGASVCSKYTNTRERESARTRVSHARAAAGPDFGFFSVLIWVRRSESLNWFFLKHQPSGSSAGFLNSAPRLAAARRDSPVRVTAEKEPLLLLRSGARVQAQGDDVRGARSFPPSNVVPALRHQAADVSMKQPVRAADR